MAKFRSLFRVSGDIGDVNFYEKNGQKYMRQTTSLTKDRIEHDDAFKRTRENNREFGGVAAVGRSFRVGLAMVLKRFSDEHFGGRLVRIFKQMQKGSSTGQRGKRPIEVVANKGKLVGKNLHQADLLEMVFKAPYTATPNVARNEVTVDIPVFDIESLVNAPRGTTHFKFVLVAAALSDHVYNGNEGLYVAVDPDLNGLSAYVSSTALDVDVVMTAPVQLVASLPGSPTMTPTTGLVTCFGIEFYQQVSGNLYFLASGNGMKVVDIF